MCQQFGGCPPCHMCSMPQPESGPNWPFLWPRRATRCERPYWILPWEVRDGFMWPLTLAQAMRRKPCSTSRLKAQVSTESPGAQGHSWVRTSEIPSPPSRKEQESFSGTDRVPGGQGSPQPMQSLRPAETVGSSWSWGTNQAWTLCVTLSWVYWHRKKWGYGWALVQEILIGWDRGEAWPVPVGQAGSSWSAASGLEHACMLSRFSHVRLCATLWTVACQASLSREF